MKTHRRFRCPACDELYRVHVSRFRLHEDKPLRQVKCPGCEAIVQQRVTKGAMRLLRYDRVRAAWKERNQNDDLRAMRDAVESGAWAYAWAHVTTPADVVEVDA